MEWLLLVAASMRHGVAGPALLDWYDNELGYSYRLVDLIAKDGETIPAAVA